MNNLDVNKPDPISKKFNLSKVAIIVLLGIVAVLGFLCWYQNRRANLAEQKANINIKTVNQAAKIINRYVDSSGKNHAVIKADENVLPSDWHKGKVAISGGLIDTVAKALNIARSQLQSVTQIATVSQARNLKAERTIDSLKRLTYYYRDRYLQLAFRPANTADTTDKGTFEFQYNDSINVVQYQKKKFFLGSNQSYIDIFSNDPRTTINGVKRLTVKQREPMFGLRLQAVSSYSFSRGLLQFGPGVQFDIKKFSIVGNYYYDFASDQWRPSIGARYDLVRF